MRERRTTSRDASSQPEPGEGPAEGSPEAGAPQELLDGLDAVIWEAEAPSLRVDRVAGRPGAILGYPPGRWLADPDIWHRILHPEDRESVLTRIHRLDESSPVAVLTYRAIAFDGQVVWIRDRVELVDPGNGSPGRLRGMMLDVTGEKRAQEELARERDRYRVVAEAVQDIISVHDEDGAFLHVSPAVTPMLGYDPASLVGRTLEDLAHPEDRHVLETAWAAALSGERPAPVVLRARTADGSARWCELTIRPAAEGGEWGINGIVTLLRDVSGRRALEDQLLHAQRVEGLGRLARGVSHDVSHLLDVITGKANNLGTALPEGSPHADDLEELREAARMAAFLTSQLASYGRKGTASPRVLQPNQVVRSLESLLHRTAGPRVALRLDLAPDVGAVRMDPEHLRQALVNLVTNARDAMSEGGTVTVRTWAEAVDGPPEEVGVAADHAVVSVEDEGTGMDETTRRRAFEPFFTTKAAGGGSGLGLATVQRSVRESGGEVRVRSEPGKGSRFDLFLPVTEEPGGERQRDRAPAVLLVEADVPSQRLLQSTLERSGHRVLPAEGPREAVAWFRESPAEVGLLMAADPESPEVRDLVRALRSERPEIPVVFITDPRGGDEAEVRSGGPVDGPMEWLKKPFTPREALARVRAALSEASRRGGSEG